MLRPFFQSRLLPLMMAPLFLTIGMERALSDEVKTVNLQEDALITIRGLPWAAPKWPYNRVVNIEKFGGAVVGKAVLDRHGEQVPIDNVLIKDPFGEFYGLKPVSLVFVSQWGSKQAGCYAEMLVQVAPPPPANLSAEDALQLLVPTLIEIAVGNGRVVELKPQKIQPKVFGGEYTYQDSRDQQRYRSNWYMARNIFAVNANQAEMLRTAQPGKATLRVSFADGNAYQFPIGKGTVSLWKEVYDYNPTCRPGGAQAKRPTTTPTTPTTQPQVKPDDKIAARPSPAPIELPPEAPPPPKAPVQGNPSESPFPSNAEFAAIDRQIASNNLVSNVRLSSTERKKRRAFQQGWMKANPSIARFVGTWYAGDLTFYIYPSKFKRRVCVVTQQKETIDYHLGVVSGKELRFGSRSLFWIEKEDMLAARETGTSELYPIFAIAGSAQLPPDVVVEFDKADCNKSLPAAEGAS
ncbi:MAG: hypothetical protein KME16_14920 [Scytolyngbya sp. HA4215-MV1]|nr:hypothetical protein [Scytolyngbya sp. HA4215-MV1]